MVDDDVLGLKDHGSTGHQRERQQTAQREPDQHVGPLDDEVLLRPLLLDRA